MRAQVNDLELGCKYIKLVKPILVVLRVLSISSVGFGYGSSHLKL